VDPITTTHARTLDVLVRSAGESRPTESATPATLLPTPAQIVGDDAGARIEAILLESAAQDLASAQESRERQEALLESAEAAELHAMQERADDAFTANVLGGAATAASGGVALGAGETPGAQAASRIVEGSGRVASALAQHEADVAGAESTHEEQLAGRFRRGLDDANEQKRVARELCDRAVELFKEYVAAKGEAQKAVLLRA
jgi:hypothetical protein